MSYYVNPHGHSCPWFPYAEQFGAPNINWCEQSLCAWIDQPVNAYSSGAYALVALALIWFSYRSRQMELRVLNILIFAVGCASFLYHISNNYMSQMLDMLAIFGLLFWMIALNLKRMELITQKTYPYVAIGGALLTGVIAHVMYMLHLPFQYLIAVVAVFMLSLEYMISKNKVEGTNYYFLGTAGALTLVGQVFSLLDRNKLLCDPSNQYFQGHALWHVITAIALGLTYFHYHQFDYLEGGLADYSVLEEDDEMNDYAETTDPNIDLEEFKAFNKSAPIEMKVPKEERKPKERQNPYSEDIESQLEQ